MSHSSTDQPHNDNPTTAEIFRVFRNATVANISGMKLLLEECADLRSELVTIHRLHGDGDGYGTFSSRQRSRILELKEAANHMEDMLVSLYGPAADHTYDG